MSVTFIKECIWKHDLVSTNVIERNIYLDQLSSKYHFFGLLYSDTLECFRWWLKLSATNFESSCLM